MRSCCWPQLPGCAYCERCGGSPCDGCGGAAARGGRVLLRLLRRRQRRARLLRWRRRARRRRRHLHPQLLPRPDAGRELHAERLVAVLNLDLLPGLRALRHRDRQRLRLRRRPRGGGQPVVLDVLRELVREVRVRRQVAQVLLLRQPGLLLLPQLRLAPLLAPPLRELFLLLPSLSVLCRPPRALLLHTLLLDPALLLLALLAQPPLLLLPFADLLLLPPLCAVHQLLRDDLFDRVPPEVGDQVFIGRPAVQASHQVVVPARARGQRVA